jgi:hypothetical protein
MATKTKDQLIKEAKKLGIELTGEETNAEMQDAINFKLEENENAGGGETAEEKKARKDAEGKKGKKKVYFYHVKVKAFKNGEERVEIGLYKTNELVERFEKMSNEYVERYDDEMPILDLHEIAVKFKVSVYEEGGKKARDEDAILEELVKEL